MKIQIHQAEAGTTHVLIAQRAFFGRPLERNVYVVLDLEEVLHSLGLIKDHVGIVRLRTPAPDLTGSFLIRDHWNESRPPVRRRMVALADAHWRATDNRWLRCSGTETPEDCTAVRDEASILWAVRRRTSSTVSSHPPPCASKTNGVNARFM